MPKKRRYSYDIPQDPSKLANKWHKLAGEHFSSYERVREWCNLRFDRFLAAEERIAIGDEITILDDGTHVSELPSATEIKCVVQCLQLAIEGERQALAMQYRDANVAVARVEQLGFLIQSAEGAIDVKAEYVQE